MKNKILILGFFASLLIPQLLRAQEANEQTPVQLVQLTPEDKIYICTKDPLEIEYYNPDNSIGKYAGDHPEHLADGVDIFLHNHNENFHYVALYNQDEEIVAPNTDIVVVIFPTLIKSIFSTGDNSAPYAQYIAASDNTTQACTEEKAPSQGYIFLLNLDPRNRNLAKAKVKVIQSTEASPDNSGADQNPPAGGDMAAGDGSGADAAVAPQSGGCSMGAALPGLNYGFSILFSLILGAHALLRFRKK